MVIINERYSLQEFMVTIEYSRDFTSRFRAADLVRSVADAIQRTWTLVSKRMGVWVFIMDF